MATSEKIYQCNLCSKAYNQCSNLKRHGRTVHPFSKKFQIPESDSASKPYSCRICNKKFTLKKTRRRHEISLHKYQHVEVRITKRQRERDKKFACSFCPKRFDLLRNCEKHVNIVHKCHPVEKKFSCQFCQKHFTLLKNCRLHEKKFHRVFAHVRNYNCSECSKVFSSKSSFVDHFNEHPNITIQTQVKTFQSHGDFIKWKNTTEKKTASRFSLKHKYKKNSSMVHSYECHRSGNFKSQSKGIRHMKKQGSIKIGAFCPARILYETPLNGGAPTIKFTSTHVGHQCDYDRIRLHKEHKNEIAGQLLAGVPMLKSSESIVEPSRLENTQMQDIRNVESSSDISILECHLSSIEEDSDKSEIEDEPRKVASDSLREKTIRSIKMTLQRALDLVQSNQLSYEQCKFIFDFLTQFNSNLDAMSTSKKNLSPAVHRTVQNENISQQRKKVTKAKLK